MFLSSSLGGDRVVEGPIAQHGEQDVAATPSESDQGLVVAFALTDLAIVVRAGYRAAQCSERREEQRSLEHLVAPPGRMFSADRGSGAAGHRGQSGVCGQVCCGVEVAAYDLRQKSCGGPVADPWQAHQDRAKRVSVHPDLDLSGEFLALHAQGAQLLHQAGRDQPDDLGARHNDMLLAERLAEALSQALGHAGRKFLQACDQPLTAHSSEGGGCRVSLQQIEHRRMIEMRTENARAPDGSA